MLSKHKNRLSLSLFLIIICLCSLVFTSATASPQSGKRIDLSAGKAGQALIIPQPVWANLNSFVFLIGFDFYQPGVINVEYAKRFGQLKAFPELRAATIQWGNETFPLLQRLATELSKGDIKNLLSELNAAFSRRKSDPSGAQREFEEKFNQINQRFQSLGQMSDTINQQFSRLEKASRAAIYEYKSRKFPENPWVNIGPNLDDMQQAFGVMNGQWNALRSDLTDLQRLMANRKLDDIDIEVGLLTWDSVTESAKGFVLNIPAQLKYLNGDNYYDNFQFDENSYYVILNGSAKTSVLIAQDKTVILIPALTAAPTDLRQQWRFRKHGRGWWKIYNRAKGDAYVLDTTQMAPIGAFSGQAWRILPTKDQGWFRMINSFKGELQSLQTSPLGVLMTNTDNRATQYWRFIKI